MQITVLFPDETCRHRELCNLHWIYPYPIANLWERQKISLKLTWPTEAFFSSVIHLSVLSPVFWRFKKCMQKSPSLYEWNSISPISSRAGSTLSGSEFHFEIELNFSVPLVLGQSFRTEHPSQFLHSSCSWNCSPAQHETLTSSPVTLALSWTCSPAQGNLAPLIPSCFPCLLCLLWQRVLQCPHLVKPTGGPKPHNLVLDQHSYFQACLSPGFLLFGIPQAWSHRRNVHLENRQFPVIQERFGIHGYIHFCI